MLCGMMRCILTPGSALKRRKLKLLCTCPSSQQTRDNTKFSQQPLALKYFVQEWRNGLISGP